LASGNQQLEVVAFVVEFETTNNPDAVDGVVCRNWKLGELALPIPEYIRWPD
jgi:hypothetical protein